MSGTAVAPAPGPGRKQAASAGASAAPAGASAAVTTGASTGTGAGARGGSAQPARRGALSTTPGRLRLLLAVTVAASIVFGLVGLQAGVVQFQAMANADAESRQLVGVQELQNGLVSADALASNAFLVGGLEPAEQREAYDDEIQAASRQVAELSGANSGDATLLAAVSDDLTKYTALVESARANNRQGFPVGSAYLDQASTLLRTDILPTIEKLVDASASRVASSYATAQNSLWLLAIALLALVVLVLGQLWLTRTTHRYLNPNLVTATGLVLVLGIGGTVAFASTASTVQSTRESSYAATLAVSQALTAATDAKSQESQTLIKRGSGAAIEAQFDTNVAEAQGRLDDAAASGIIGSELGSLLTTWVDAHDGIRELDDGGNWDEAVQRAIATGDGSANAAFTAFDDAATTQVEASAETTETALEGAALLSIIAGGVLLLVGIGAAVLSARGVSIRLREYR